MKSRVFRRLAALSVTALGGLLLALDANAGDNVVPEHPMMSDRFFVGAGAAWVQSNVTANANRGRIGLGSFIDFEDDVGLEKSNLLGMFDFRMRLSERWLLEAEYFRLDRSGERELSRTVDWGDLNIPVNALVSGSSDLEDLRISVGYSFFRRKDKEVGFGLGAHVMSFDAELSTRNLGSERASQSAPLPVLTMYAQFALTNRWLLRVRVDRLSLDTGEVDGSIFSSATDFVYQPWRHFGLGLGYRDINMTISSTSESWRGKAQVRHTGPYLFISGSF
ncbi:MAG TPA: hypothetical protein VF226_03740 [Hyphomicrobiaceae bacterium]